MEQKKRISKSVAAGFIGLVVCSLILGAIGIVLLVISANAWCGLLLAPYGFCAGYGVTKSEELYDEYFY